MTVAETRRLRRETPWSPALHAHPIFLPVRRFFARFASEVAFPSVETIDRLLGPHAGVRFVRQTVPSRRGRYKHVGKPYDEAIASGCVPTREAHWHDFMNALVWAAYPRAKRAVHALQRSLLAEARDRGLVGRRLPEHDALAVLDEGGILALSPVPLHDDDALDAALANGTARAMCFGHAVMEAVAIRGPWPLVRALVVPMDEVKVPDLDPTRAVDAALAALLADASRLATPRSLLRVSLVHAGATPEWHRAAPSAPRDEVSP